ncbi:ATPase family AAA domain-containing protein 5-like [Oncorhynchus mykiss]|uniref:ATPase family AAA domain-containing protein 5-like n=1 Tax=Oncorhynchus mykiss TaxID=8022 RepID=UPI001877A03D|nr:ATPase family AAA domain-containing protein 5-like [Oncorhynchus mykiss]
MSSICIENDVKLNHNMKTVFRSLLQGLSLAATLKRSFLKQPSVVSRASWHHCIPSPNVHDMKLLLHLVSVCRAPSQVNVCSYLQLLCLAENVRMDAGDITSLVSLNQMHIRRTLLQLWICSGGGQASQRATPLKDPAGMELWLLLQWVTMLLPAILRDVGCTSSMLGLLNSGPSHDLQTTLKCQSWARPDTIKLMEILTEV